ncbi:hypothetical protein RhiirA4_486973, partial [Rhizophagus irregularis]
KFNTKFPTKGISKICHPGIIANFIYKVVELATYTSAFATDAINILTRNTLNTGCYSTRQNYETIEDEELPPLYDNSWSMPSSTTTTFATTNTTTTETKPPLTIPTSPSQQDYPTTQTETKPSLTISTSPSQQDYPTTQTSPSQQNYPTTQTETKPSLIISTSPSQQLLKLLKKLFIRCKSSSVEMSNTSDTHSDSNVDDDEDIILKSINCNISVMIAEAEAALNSKVEVTVEMILVEEKEREEQIMKEFWNSNSN